MRQKWKFSAALRLQSFSELSLLILWVVCVYVVFVFVFKLQFFFFLLFDSKKFIKVPLIYVVVSVF